MVALGEHCHFIDEFAAMRRRILRFLIERCGFTVLAFEYGFCEAIPLDAWAQGQGADDDLSALLATALPIGLQEAARLIRRHNRTAAAPVRFAGIDIPAAGGSLLPALTPVADYLRRIDPETLPTVQTAITIAASFAGDSAAVAAPAWARLPTTERDTLTAVLPAAFCHGPRPRRLVVGRLPVRHEGGDLGRVVGEGVQLDGRQGPPSARWRSPGPAMGGEGG
ncbi:erythromycin esterase family protein [Streptomyces sp. NPDC053792]|uniref:erythromycin esterase family protein n=1 Tax=Streptomyces sp. NPDC053792 TaxID=3365716 RepID=UPI0037D2B99F